MFVGSSINGFSCNFPSLAFLVGKKYFNELECAFNEDFGLALRLLAVSMEQTRFG